MKKLVLRITPVMALVFLFISLYDFDSLNAMGWPSDNANLIRNFGLNDRGKPALGMVFSGETDILAAEKGEVIFSQGADNTTSRLPSPLGSWIALDHGDGLISIYSRFKDEKCSVVYADTQELMAKSGASGWSNREGFYFIVFDRRERRWINPAMIITPLREAIPLQITSVDLKDSQGLLLTQPGSCVQGRYSILVSGGSRNNLAPQRIVVSVNGVEAGSLNFEAVSSRDGVLMVYRNGLVPARQIYSNYQSYEAADVFLNRGQATIEIIMQDIAGNSRSIINRIYVN
jgi:hypothetical protein